MIQPTLLLGQPRKQGLSHRAIARQLHMHRESVIRYARAETFPEQAERPAHPGILAPYETYLWTRWVEGERNAVGLFREVTARGYTGSRMTIERFLLGLRRMEQQGIARQSSGNLCRTDAPSSGGFDASPHPRPHV